MKLYDGVSVSTLSDQQLKSEYVAINNHTYHPFYKDKLGYLWFRMREIYYELQRRDQEADPPSSFVGMAKKDFNHWTPSLEWKRDAKTRALSDMDGHTRYGKPIKVPQHEKVGIVR